MLNKAAKFMNKCVACMSGYVRVHGHGGKFGIDFSAGIPCCVTGERLRRRHLVPPAELQWTAAVHLLDLRQVRLGCNHHAGGLAVHEVLLKGEKSVLRTAAIRMSGFKYKKTLLYLKNFGAVFKGVRVAGIIDQADNVTSQIRVRQVVEVGEYFMQLKRREKCQSTIDGGKAFEF